MKVKDLKEALNKLPDDLTVCISTDMTGREKYLYTEIIGAFQGINEEDYLCILETV